MKKYDNLNISDGYSAPPDDIVAKLGEDEEILWAGKPKKSAYIAARITPMLPIVLIWAVFDGTILSMVFRNISSIPSMMIIILGAFFALHLIPVWAWLYLLLTAPKAYKTAYYLITDKSVYIKEYKRKARIEEIPLRTLHGVYLKKTSSDGTGTLRLSGRSRKAALYAVEKAYEVKALLQRLLDGEDERHARTQTEAKFSYTRSNSVVNLSDIDDPNDIIHGNSDASEPAAYNGYGSTTDNNTSYKSYSDETADSDKSYTAENTVSAQDSASDDDLLIDKNEFDMLFSDDYDDRSDK